MLLSVKEWRLLKKCLDKAKRSYTILSDEEYNLAIKLSAKLEKKITEEEKQTILIEG